MKHSLDLKTLVFYTLMLVSGILALNLFSRYLNLIIISLVIVQIFHPLFRFIKNRSKSTALSTLISVLTVIFFLIVPLTIILILAVSEIRGIAESSSVFDSVSNLEIAINNFIIQINQFTSRLGLELSLSQLNLAQSFAELDKTAFVRDQLFPLVTSIASLSGEILFTLFLVLISLIYIFPSYDKLPSAIQKISPLEDDVDMLIIDKFRKTIKGVIKGTLVVALLQATAVIIPFLMLQVGAPVLLWVLMVILSVVPIGSGLVWAPVGLAIILGGISDGNPTNIILGTALIVYSAIIINIIDTTIRPKLMKNNVNLHPLITIFSVLGGIGIFGFIGVLYGPIIVVLFLTVMEVYRTKYLPKKESTENES